MLEYVLVGKAKGGSNEDSGKKKTNIYPWKLTVWTQKMEVWKMISLIKRMMFRFHVEFSKEYIQESGQIIATSHDITPNGGLVIEIPLFQGNLGWWNIIIWPE